MSDTRFGHTSIDTSMTPIAFQNPHNGLRADFDAPTDFFEITFISPSIFSYAAILQAYDINNNLLEEVILDFPQSDSVMATINTPGISWIYASGEGGTAVSIDLIRYNAVPIPAAVWLFGSGLLGLIGIARKKTA